MIAERHGKLSIAARGELERAEDLLTDYVFGALRHLPGTVLRGLLQSWFPADDWDATDVYAALFRFWPTFGNTEPDVVIQVGTRVVVVEAKLWSGFGVGLDEGDHQLNREYNVAARWAEVRHLDPPRVLVVTASFDEPAEVEAARVFTGQATAFAWTNWQSIAGYLDEVRPGLAEHEQRLVEDLLAVMARRGVRRMFEGFQQEDYWLMAAAQRRSTESVFPTIASFSKDLLARLDDEGMGLGANENRIFSHGSSSLDAPERWGANYLYLPVWPRGWPERREWLDASLFVQFSLREPEVWVGYRHRIKTKDKAPWQLHLDEIVAGLRQLGDRTVGQANYPDLGVLIRQVNAESLDIELLETILGEKEVFLSVFRTLPLGEIASTAVVAAMMVEDRDAITSVPHVLEDCLPKK